MNLGFNFITYFLPYELGHYRLLVAPCFDLFFVGYFIFPVYTLHFHFTLTFTRIVVMYQIVKLKSLHFTLFSNSIFFTILIFYIILKNGIFQKNILCVNM